MYISYATQLQFSIHTESKTQINISVVYRVNRDTAYSHSVAILCILSFANIKANFISVPRHWVMGGSVLYCDTWRHCQTC